MPYYAVTGASRGLGLEFVRQLSTKPENVVFAIVRNVQGAQELQEFAKSSPNVFIEQGDLVDNESLKAAAQSIARKTGGTLDYLINNAASIDPEPDFDKLTDYVGHEDLLKKHFFEKYEINVIGVIQTINVFLPLLRNGRVKKVITISSAVGDTDFTLGVSYAGNPPYTASKAAINNINAKYATQFRDEGFTFLAISPGLVDTSTTPPTPEKLQTAQKMVESFKKYAPHWRGSPLTPTESVSLVIQVIDKTTTTDNGAFVSHFGNKGWL